jgi:hypothetical protein
MYNLYMHLYNHLHNGQPCGLASLGVPWYRLARCAHCSLMPAPLRCY